MTTPFEPATREAAAWSTYTGKMSSCLLTNSELPGGPHRRGTEKANVSSLRRKQESDERTIQRSTNAMPSTNAHGAFGIRVTSLHPSILHHWSPITISAGAVRVTPFGRGTLLLQVPSTTGCASISDLPESVISAEPKAQRSSTGRIKTTRTEGFATTGSASADRATSRSTTPITTARAGTPRSANRSVTS